MDHSLSPDRVSLTPVQVDPVLPPFFPKASLSKPSDPRSVRFINISNNKKQSSVVTRYNVWTDRTGRGRWNLLPSFQPVLQFVFLNLNTSIPPMLTESRSLQPMENSLHDEQFETGPKTVK
jgi:hypothetical protein